MSSSGLSQTYQPNTLDGLNVLEADQIYIDGQLVNLDNLVPYTGANKTVNLGSQNIQTTHNPTLGPDLINLTTLTNAVTYVDEGNSLTYLNKVTTTEQNVAAATTFSSTVTANYFYTDNSYNWGRPSSSYNAWAIGRILNSGVIRDLQFKDDTAGVTTLLLSSTGQTVYVGLTCNYATGSKIPIFDSDRKLVSSGVDSIKITYLDNVSSDIQASLNARAVLVGGNSFSGSQNYSDKTASTVAIFDGSKNLVSSAVSVTELNFIGGVTSGVQTQINGKLSLTGGTMTGDIGLGANKITSTATPVTDDTLTRKGYVDSAISGAGSLYVLKTGSTMTGALIVDAGVSVGTRLLGTNDGVSSGNFWIGLRGTGTETERLAISITGASTTGIVSGVTIAKPLTLTATGITANRVPYVDGSLVLKTSSVTFSELLNLVGTTAGIQSQFDAIFTTLPNFLPKFGGTLTGTLFFTTTTKAIDISISGASAPVSAYMKLASTSNFYDGTASTSYLMSSKNGYISVAKKTTQTTEATLHIGSDGTSSEIVSIASDITEGLTPLNFSASSHTFSNGNIIVGASDVGSYDSIIWSRTTNQPSIQMGSNYLSYASGGGAWASDAVIGDMILRTNSKAIRFNINNGGASSLIIDSTGNVGIGTATPGAVLEIYSSTADYTNSLRVKTLWPSLRLDGSLTSGGRIWTIINGGTGSGIGVGNFGIFDDTASAYRFVINSTGNVGIGITNPSEKLTVVGNVSITGNQQLTGTNITYGILQTYANATGAPSMIYSHNEVTGDGYAVFHLKNDTGAGAYWFLNSSARTADGGENGATLRNDIGKLHLQSQGGNGFTIDATTGYTRKYGGDTSKILYGPNATWGAYLVVGAGTNEVSSNKAQVISTNGNLHLDAGLGLDIYIGYYPYSAGQPNTIRSYGSWSHTGNFISDITCTTNITGNEVYTNSWFRVNANNNGLYWQNLGRGIQSPEGAGNTYGTISTYGSGRSTWNGYGLDSKYCFMKSQNTDQWGIHDNSYSWIILGSGGSARDITIGGGVAMFSRNYDRCLMYANGNDTGGGYFYYNQNNAYGTISDRRIKKDFLSITEEQSIAFIKALEPTSFCLKDSTCKTTLADGEEVEEVGGGVCSCRQDGWVAQNVLEACNVSGASKSVINHWYDYEQELEKPEEERTTLIGVSDRPILSHTVNVVKVLMAQIDTLTQRNQVLEAHARQQEKAFTDYKKDTDKKIEKLASLIGQLMSK